jgi:hypothetical protein
VISKRWSGAWRRDFLADVVASAPQLEAVRQLFNRGVFR